MLDIANCYKYAENDAPPHLQDNVFVNVVASIQYRALSDKANDAFYKLTNTRTQIQAYVFDGTKFDTKSLCFTNPRLNTTAKLN